MTNKSPNVERRMLDDVFVDIGLCGKTGVSDEHIKYKNIIEASAGTGKTYSIECLFLKFILECDFDIDSILIITFTNRATDELKERLNKRLKISLDYLKGNVAHDQNDPMHRYLHSLDRNDLTINVDLKGQSPFMSKNILILENALNNFDEAAIHTIHSFCDRLLLEFPFESGTTFNRELYGEDDYYVKLTVEDFWRNEVFSLTAEAYNKIKELSRKYNYLKLDLDKLITLATEVVRYPDFKRKILPEIDCDSEENTLNKLRSLKKEKIALKEMFNNDTVQLKNLHLESDIFEYLEDFVFNDDVIIFNLPETSKITLDDLKVKHPIFQKISDISAEAIPLIDKIGFNTLIYFRIKLLKVIDKRIDHIKEINNEITYSDQLKDLYNAVIIKDNSKLLEKIRKKYNALVVDEFQDTDLLQYSILKHIFYDTDKFVFFIGDPKQSIYKFRGADIYVYLEAISEADIIYSLKKNFRSTENLIDAFNLLYTLGGNPFLIEGIQYNPVEAGGEKYKIEGETSNLVIKHFDGTSIDKDRAEKKATDDIIYEIKRLLHKDNHVKISENGILRPIEGRDIAIIMFENKDGELLRKELNKNGIVACASSRESVYKSEEARELKMFLVALANPANYIALNTALTTSLFNLTAIEMVEISKKEDMATDIIKNFIHYQELLSSYGFYRMMMEFINDYHLKERLLQVPSGDRKITNFLHLIELIQKAHKKGIKGIYEIIKWLEEKEMQPKSSAEEEQMLRLESEENAVNIVTIHKSKGLEFPIVFVPYFWNDSKFKIGFRNVIFHEDDKVKIDVGSEENKYRDNIAKTTFEILAENLRLLYVAMTRAACKCYLYYPHTNSQSKKICSAINYLLHITQENKNILNIKNIEDILGLKDYNQRIDELKIIAEKSKGNIEVTLLKENDPGQFEKQQENIVPLVERTFNKNINKKYLITSYTGLTRFGQLEERMPALDELFNNVETSDNKDLRGIFAFDKGIASGNLWHKIMENLDFNADKNTRDIYIKKQLEKTKYKTDEFVNAMTTVIDNLLNKNLGTFLGTSLYLKDITQKNRISELEFYLNIKDLSKLKDVLMDYFKKKNKTNFLNSTNKLKFEELESYVNGFIDLVFTDGNKYYVIDWKFSFLGGNADDYNTINLEKEMLGNYYYLQYHLYILALYKYLKTKNKSIDMEHIGGVFYIFARGIQHGKDTGIYFDRPIEFLQRCEDVI